MAQAKKENYFFRATNGYDLKKTKTNLDQANAQAERNAKSNYNMKLKNNLADRSLSSKKWWGIVNSLSGRTGHSEIPAIEHSDTVYTTAKDKANIFC